MTARRVALWLLVAVVVGFVSVCVVLVTVDATTVTVHDKADQRDMAFGWPFRWIHQDQTALDPPYPFTEKLGSPMKLPTRTTDAFWVDVALVGAVISSVLLVGRATLLRLARRGRAGELAA